MQNALAKFKEFIMTLCFSMGSGSFEIKKEKISRKILSGSLK
jgi:hypothetical protein